MARTSADDNTGPDSISGGEFESIEVVSRAPAAARISSDGSLTLSASALNHTMRALGEADMIKIMTLLPGVNATSDYGAGATIDGAEQSQTLYRMDGAPVFFPYHFGGIFSTFIATHFPSAAIRKSIRPASDPNRLGAVIDFKPSHSVPDGFTGSVNVGMMSASTTLRIPVGNRISVTVSARRSFLNQIYPWVLDGNTTSIRYDLTDLNASVLYRPTDRDQILINAFYNRDRLKVTDTNFSMATAMRWHNTVASAGWVHTARNFTTGHTVYRSGFGNRLQIDMASEALAVPSSVDQTGINGSFDFPSPHIKIGYGLSHTSAIPQWSRTTGHAESSAGVRHKEHATEARLYAQLRIKPSAATEIEAGISATRYFAGGHYRRFHADPSIAASLSAGSATFSIQAARRHQFIHCTGFSDIGLASNFWSVADVRAPEQSAWVFALNANSPVRQAGLTVNLDVYYKRIGSQPEYSGYILDLLDPDYDAKSQMSTGRGYNTGFDIMLKRDEGALTGWISYAYCIARRKFRDNPETYVTSASELRHALTIFADYRLRSRWNFSATFTLASGRPVTPVKAIYVIGENIISESGERNSSRLPAYHRLDLSATYRFPSGGGRMRHYINLSLLNAYGHENVEIQSFALDPETGRYYLRQISSLYRFFPSVSYTVEF